MSVVNWSIFRAKFHDRESSEFESLAYLLFCQEHAIKRGIFRFKNQTGIETEPVSCNGKITGFQAKFYDIPIARKKAEIIKSLQKAKAKNPELEVVFLYINQELSESKSKKKKNPKYLADIDATALKLGLQITWRVPSHYEKQLADAENTHLAKYFFENGKSILDFLQSVKEHTQNILYAIQTTIVFKSKQIKIDRSNLVDCLEKEKYEVMILSGDGGCGKTALIKDLVERNNVPCYLLKAAEFTKNSVSSIFGQFGDYSLEDFVHAHKEEPVKIFVIDSAEKLADLESQDVFSEFLSALLKNGWKIIFTTRNSYTEDLSWQMTAVYRKSFHLMQLQNLSESELRKLSTDYDFVLPLHPRLLYLLRNLFYLQEYLQNYDLMHTDADPVRFRDLLWQRKIQQSSYRKDNTHIERERCFLQLIKERCDTGNFFLKGTGCSFRILALLQADEVINYDKDQDAFFITHDIYEEWGLEKYLERAYAGSASHASFFVSIGNSLPVRRAFRMWLPDKLAQPEGLILQFIEQVFSDRAIAATWKDELFVSVLLSDYATRFLERFEEDLLKEEKSLLKKMIFLARTACKEMDPVLQFITRSKKQAEFNPTSIYMRPKGNGWPALIAFLFNHLNSFETAELSVFLPLLEDWVNKNTEGPSTRFCGLLALHYYREAETKEDVYYPSEIETQLLRIVLASSKELKQELTDIARSLVDKPPNRREAFDSLRQKVLKGDSDSIAFLVTLPKFALQFADEAWYTNAKEETKFGLRGFGLEGDYGIPATFHHDYHPASALQTPIYYLLHISFEDTVQFILDFTNRAVETYFQSAADSSVQRIPVKIGNELTSQVASPGLWSMYRGFGTPVIPSLLQSIHMALEKRLLEFTDVKKLEPWLIHLLRNSRSVSITAVVTSLVLKFPDELFSVATILFQNRVFFRLDNMRAAGEHRAKGLYSISLGMNANTQIYAEERMKTCDDPHRKNSLEGLARWYQFFRNAGTTAEEAEKRQKIIWEIIDKLRAEPPAEGTDPETPNEIRLLFARIDGRTMNPTVTHSEDNLIFSFNPELGEELTKYSEQGLQKIHEKFKYANLKSWATDIVEPGHLEKEDPRYDDHPELVVQEIKEILEGLLEPNEEFRLFNGSIPAYCCAALIKKYADRLSDEDHLLCSGIVLEFATLPLQENYAYQIADGVEVAISVLPLLYTRYSDQRSVMNLILLLVLFDAYSIGNKRICDYAIESIRNSLFAIAPQDANAILLAYLKFKPTFDVSLRKAYRLKKRKTRVQVLDSFTIKHAAELEEINFSQEYYQQVDVNLLDIQVAETAFQLIPADTTSPIHLDFISKILTRFSHIVLSGDNNEDDAAGPDYYLNHRFFDHYAKFLLYREISTIHSWTQSFIDAFAVTDAMADFFSSLITEEHRLIRYEEFWVTWECFYPSIKLALQHSSHYRVDPIVRNYLLAWSYWGKETYSWHSLKEREKIFLQKVCLELGVYPVVLYSISKLLNSIASPFLEEGIVWVVNILTTNQTVYETEITPNTIYYLESIARKYVFLHRTKLKTIPHLRNTLLILLDFLVKKGSANGYLLREDIF